MTATQQIIFDELINNGYQPTQVTFKNVLTVKRRFGWFALMEDETLFYLGQRTDSVLYNIHSKTIQPA